MSDPVPKRAYWVPHRPPAADDTMVLRVYLVDVMVAEGYDRDDALTLLRQRVIDNPSWPMTARRTRDAWAAWEHEHDPLAGL